jgi:hypothetical protein
MTVRANWQVKKELENFEFYSIGSALTVTRPKDLYATEYVLPDYVTGIGEGAFKDCARLSSISIPDGVTVIGAEAFSGCVQLKSFVIPPNVSILEADVFRGCTSLLSVTISEGVEVIENDAFAGCVSLIEVVNNSTLTIEVGSSENGGVAKNALIVCEGASNLCTEGDFLCLVYNELGYLVEYSGKESDVVLPDTLGGYGYTICSYAFDSNLKLNSVVISDGVLSISDDAFYMCPNLYSVTLGAGLATVEDGAFNNCYRLVEVINKSTLPIEKGSENYGSVALFAKAVHSGESIIDKVGDFYFITANKKNYLFAYVGDVEDLTLPEDYNGETYGLAEYIFKDNLGLRVVRIPEKVRFIGKRAFENAKNVYGVVFKQPIGWWVAPVEAESGTSISGSTVSAGSGAAKFLKENYVNHYWGLG